MTTPNLVKWPLSAIPYLVKAKILEHYDYRFKSVDELTDNTPLYYPFGDEFEGPPPVPTQRMFNGKMVGWIDGLSSFPLSSLMSILVVMELEDELQIEVMDAEAELADTVGKLISLIESKVNVK